MTLETSAGLPPELPGTATAVAAHYRYPERAGDAVLVRANMVSSLDGAASVDGTSGGLGGDGDRRVFAALRGLADVVLVAAGTVAAEEYGAPSPDPDFAAARSAADQPPAPRMAVVSGSLSLDPGSPVATAAGTVVLTRAGAPADRRAALVAAGVEVIDCGTDEVDMTVALRALAARGWWRVLCEGGPSLLGGMAAAGLVDELCLTIAPLLVAGDGGRITRSSAADPRSMTPVHVLTDDDGYLYTRWRRR